MAVSGNASRAVVADENSQLYIIDLKTEKSRKMQNPDPGVIKDIAFSHKKFGLLIGTSRKSFIGRVLDLPVDSRLFGTAATVALSVERGADIVRVHDVVEMSQVARMADAIAGRSRP